MGDKVGSFLQFMGMFFVGFGIGFAYGWKLTLVVLSIVPLLGAAGALFAKALASSAGGAQGFYAKAGGIADEVLRMIRTVIAFDSQEKVCGGERGEGSSGELTNLCFLGRKLSATAAPLTRRARLASTPAGPRAWAWASSSS